MDEPEDGDCFVVAFKLCDENEWMLCHGTVTRAADGVRHEHAWVEVRGKLSVPVDGRVVEVPSVLAVDRANGHDVTLPALAFRNLGQISDVVEYTPDEARALALQTGHFGPWG